MQPTPSQVQNVNASADSIARGPGDRGAKVARLEHLARVAARDGAPTADHWRQHAERLRAVERASRGALVT